MSDEGTGTDADAHEPVGDEPSENDPVDETEFELGPAPDPIAVARRRHGAAGAMLAAGLFGIDVALGRKPREDIPVVVASSSEPTDIDTEGIEIAVDEHTTLVAPALPRSEPTPRPRRARRAGRAR
ncbi:MAG: hypothetical protein ABIR68_04090 [Ilumatobacteraceae bacterium]